MFPLPHIVDRAASFHAKRPAVAQGALDFARHLLKLAPQAMGMGKHIINMCQNVDTEAGRLLDLLGQSILIRTEDNKEGMNAFLQKRRPRFKGK
jgi:enoyl-CoA hydratase/carnithine racemase